MFALMARFEAGADCISEVMHDVKVFQVLVELMTGKTIIDYNASPSVSQASSPVNTSATTPSSSSLMQQLQEPGSAAGGESGKPHAQSEEMQKMDRMNALVLLSELLKNRGDKMAVMRRALFEDLLKGGGEIVLAYNEANGGGEGAGGYADMVKEGKMVRPIEVMTKGMPLQELVKQTFNDVM